MFFTFIKLRRLIEACSDEPAPEMAAGAVSDPFQLP
jgi:hypothetical protein